MKRILAFSSILIVLSVIVRGQNITLYDGTTNASLYNSDSVMWKLMYANSNAWVYESPAPSELVVSMGTLFVFKTPKDMSNWAQDTLMFKGRVGFGNLYGMPQQLPGSGQLKFFDSLMAMDYDPAHLGPPGVGRTATLNANAQTPFNIVYYNTPTYVPLTQFVCDNGFNFSRVYALGIYPDDRADIILFEMRITGPQSQAAVETRPGLPDGYSLDQNFPNPFNPETSIRYGILKSGFVTMRVFDALGREVGRPVSQFQTPGSYEAGFNAANLPSGIYIYQLKVNDFISTKKMMVVK